MPMHGRVRSDARHGALVTALAAAALLTSCEPAPAERERSEPVHLIDAFVLSEPDSQRIGTPSGLAVTRSGQYLVADAQAGVLREHDRSGNLLRVVGRRGTGPNEWRRGPSLPRMLDDSTVIASDGGIWPVLDYGTGVTRRSIAGTVFGQLLSNVGDTLLFLHVDPQRRTGLREHVVSTGSERYGGPVTDLTATNPVAAQMFSFTAADRLAGDTIGVVIQNSNQLYVGALTGTAWDSISLAPARRRGALTEKLRALTPEVAASLPPEQAIVVGYEPSYPSLLGPVNGGTGVAVVHVDMQFIEGRRMTGRPFVTIVNRATRRVCADHELVMSNDPMPVFAMRGDTLHALSLEMVGDSAQAMIRRYVLNAEFCR